MSDARILSRRLLHRGQKVDFLEVTVEGKGGATLVRELVRHPGAVVIVPRLDDGRFVFIRNRRFAVGEVLLELPAGTLGAGEDPAECAKRELVEETGYVAAAVERLGAFYTSPGFADEEMHAFLATGLSLATQALEDGEEITVEIFSAERAARLARDGELRDAKSIAALHLALAQ
jgi:ADP-ribose pyrophosphatase